MEPNTNSRDWLIPAEERHVSILPEIATSRPGGRLEMEGLPTCKPTMGEFLEEFRPLPREALFLGIASDAQPVLLDLCDPSIGPILLVGDSGAGKTRFLQNIGLGVNALYSPKEVQFGILTAHPDEWQGFGRMPACVDVFTLAGPNTTNFLHSLYVWSFVRKSGRQSVLLFLDGLELLKGTDPGAIELLRWIMVHGPTHRLWPIVTVTPNQLGTLQNWLDVFHTFIFGHITQAGTGLLAQSEETTLRLLQAGDQFAVREGDTWLKFWMPDVTS